MNIISCAIITIKQVKMTIAKKNDKILFQKIDVCMYACVFVCTGSPPQKGKEWQEKGSEKKENGAS